MALRQTIEDPSRLDLFEKGYGKDAAAIAMEAVKLGVVGVGGSCGVERR